MRGAERGCLLACALVTIGSLTAAMPAGAADMPVKAPPVAFTWTGCYIGAHGGAAWAKDDQEGLAFRLDSGIGGAQAGCNYQTGAAVFGFEADASWGNLRDEIVGSTNIALHFRSEIEMFGTAAFRLGYAIDRLLFYGKVGGAFNRSRASLDNDVPNVFEYDGGRYTRWGWTAGGGVEYALTRNWSVKAQYDYLDFGTQRVGLTATGALATGDTSLSSKQTVHVAKAGVNFRFGP